jgi:hypothetical protein
VSIVELLAGLMVIVPVLLLCIDVATLFMGAQLNATACREAARAASNGPPSAVVSGEPQRRAETVVRRVFKTGGAVRLQPDIQCTETVRQLPDPQFGGPAIGEVTVQTKVAVYPPFLVSSVVGPQGVVLTSEHTYPITWAQGNSSTMANNGSGGGSGGTGSSGGTGTASASGSGSSGSGSSGSSGDSSGDSGGSGKGGCD